jgi:molybdate transport system regulatory protein
MARKAKSLPARSKPKAAARLSPRLRVHVGAEIALGPGKVELLEAILATGSISEAAKQLGMSYNRAWLLVRTMNRCFKEPVVQAERGGGTGGGATLTKSGRTILALYQQMTRKTLLATRPAWNELLAYFK